MRSEELSEQFKDEFENKKVLVTGGAGFIGSHIVEALVSFGAEVTIIDDFSTGSIENLVSVLGKCKVIEGDISYKSALEGIGKVDIIFNEGAVSLLQSFKDPVRDLSVNAGGTVNVLELARRFDIKVIHASTGTVYGNPTKIPISEDHPLHPISPYGVSKLAAEFYCNMYNKTYNLDVCCLRYFNVYGPRQRISEETGVIPIFVSRALSNEPLTIHGDGMQTRDFLYVTDVVRANLLAAVSGNVKGQKMNIGGEGVETTILELAHLIGKLVGKEVTLIFNNPKPGDIRRLAADISKAKTLIHYEPQISLEQGLKKCIYWYLKKDKRTEFPTQKL